MKKITAVLVFTYIIGGITDSFGQVASLSDQLMAHQRADRLVTYNLTDEGKSLPIIWGLDLAWLSEQNLRRGVNFMGADRVDVVRSSFMPTNEIVNNELTGDALNNTKYRIQLINKWLPTSTQVVLNSDHPSVNAWFKDSSSKAIAARWAQLIDITARYHQDAGRTVVTISPFNEPDYWQTGQGSIQDFFNIAQEINNNWSRFDNIRISGGNTLNPDFAKEWYDYLKSQLDEGNTHQLAGSFDNYAAFFEHVRANGHHATADELHNTMEAMVGVEYGMQTGIWWGTADYARSEFVKASDGVRLGYAEHRPNWTSGAVYRHTDGRVQAFGGTSERQAVTTTYKYLSKDRPVYYDGFGPQYEFLLELPGGTGYQVGQTNAEKVINITWGEDIQPIINGQYKLVNKNSGLVLEAGGSVVSGANMQQADYKGTANQQWEVTPVSSRIGGDFSYFHIKPATNANLTVDLINYSLEENARTQLWTASNTSNQQWYLEYVGDGYFYIRNRESSYCLQVSGASKSGGVSVVQGKPTGAGHQLWRLLPLDAPIDFKAPFANAGLEATAQKNSVLLNWVANPETDVIGYDILRSTVSGQDYELIAREVKALAFVDNSAKAGVEYFYVIKGIDQSLNKSGYSNEVSASVSGDQDLILNYDFEGTLKDFSENLNHAASYATAGFGEGMIDDQSLLFNGGSQFLQIPATSVHHESVSVAAWVKWSGGADNQRIFDFGNGETEYMMLSASVGGKMLFEMKYNGISKTMDAPALVPGEWTHVAVTIENSYAYLYINGEPADIALNFGMSAKALQPVINYLGKSQSAGPLFSGSLDDFRIYNYALDPAEVEALADTSTTVIPEVLSADNLSEKLKVWPVPASDVLHLQLEGLQNIQISIYNLSGQLEQEITEMNASGEINVSALKPGIYHLRITDQQKVYHKKIIIRR